MKNFTSQLRQLACDVIIKMVHPIVNTWVLCHVKYIYNTGHQINNKCKLFVNSMAQFPIMSKNSTTNTYRLTYA